MIAEIAAIYSRKSDFSRLSAYGFGITATKSAAQEEQCIFLTDKNMNLYLAGYKGSDKHSKSAQADAAAEQFREMMELNRAVRKPVSHIVISAAPEDSDILNEEIWQSIAHEFMAEMGYDHARWFATLHLDTDKQHIHIMACTIQDLPGNPVVGRWKEYSRAEAAMRKVELKHGLQIVRSSAQGKTINNPKRQSKKDRLRQEVDSAITAAHKENPSPTLLTLFHVFEERGIEMKVQWQRGKPKGLSFKMEEFSCTGTKLGADKRYTPAGLEQLGILIPEGRSLLELEALTAPRHTDRPATEPPTPSDHDIPVSMPKAESDLLLKSHLVSSPTTLEEENGISTWSYRVRIYPPKPGSKLSRGGILEAITGALKRVLTSVLQYLGRQQPRIEALKPEPAVTPEPIRTTIRPGKRFDEDKVAERLCRIRNDDGIPQQASPQEDACEASTNTGKNLIEDNFLLTKSPQEWDTEKGPTSNYIDPEL